MSGDEATADSALPTAATSGKTGFRYEYLVVLSVALVLYGVSVAPGPLWQDSGLAQLRVLWHDIRGTRGLALAHPLYYVLAFVFQLLPCGESALKTNIVSAVFGAVTVANVFLLLRWITRRRAAAVAGTVSLAVAHTFWQLCTLAEIYTVSTALLTTELLCLAQYARTRRVHWLALLFLAGGLGVSNHLLAVLSLPVWCVYALWLLVKRRIGIAALCACGLAWLLGAALYLSLIASELARGEPPSDVLRSALFGSAYAQNVLNLRVTGRLLVNTVLYCGLNFPTPTALLGLVGLVTACRLPSRAVGRSVVLLFVIHLVWALRYDVPDQYTFFTPVYVFAALLIGLGADRFLSTRRKPWSVAVIILAALPALVYIPLPWIARVAGARLGVRRAIPYRDSYTYFLLPWKTAYDGPWRFATETRDLVPENAVVIADFTSAYPLYYLRQTGRWKETVDIWPRPRRTPDELWPAAEEIDDSLRAGAVYIVSPQPGYCPGWVLDKELYDLEPVGFLSRVVPRSASGTETGPALRDPAAER